VLEEASLVLDELQVLQGVRADGLLRRDGLNAAFCHRDVRPMTVARFVALFRAAVCDLRVIGSRRTKGVLASLAEVGVHGTHPATRGRRTKAARQYANQMLCFGPFGQNHAPTSRLRPLIFNSFPLAWSIAFFCAKSTLNP